MKNLEEIALDVASRMVGKATSVRRAGALPTGGEIYCVRCEPPARPVTVTLTFNPNGRKAVVEWSSGSEGRNYKLCDLTPYGDNPLSTTSEQVAVKEDNP